MAYHRFAPLMMTPVLVSPCAARQGQGSDTLVPITLPHPVIHEGRVLREGPYMVVLIDEKLHLLRQINSSGAVRGTDLITVIEPTAKPLEKRDIVTRMVLDGVPWIQLQIWQNGKSYSARMKQHIPSTPKKHEAPLAPQILQEISILAEANRLVRDWGDHIWSGWKPSRDLGYSVTFPDRAVLKVSSVPDQPQGFKVIPNHTIGGNNCLIDVSGQVPGLSAMAFNIHADTDALEVNAKLVESPTPKDGGAREGERAIQRCNLTRLIWYVHEQFHFFQRQILNASNGAFTTEAWSDQFPEADPILMHEKDEIENLINAFLAKSTSKADAYVKSAFIARKKKHQAMHPRQATQDSVYASYEGGATFVTIKLAEMLQDARGGQAADSMLRFGPLAEGAAAYVREQQETLAAFKGMRGFASLKPYLLGAYWFLAMEKLGWNFRQDMFNRFKTLDQLLDHRLGPEPIQAR